ncbi:unnamed protein product [Urochloa humidicola]
MDPLEKQGVHQKKSRKSLSTSRGPTGVPSVGLDGVSGGSAGGSGTTTPSPGGGNNLHQAPSTCWPGMSLGSSFTAELKVICNRMWSCAHVVAAAACEGNRMWNCCAHGVVVRRM